MIMNAASTEGTDRRNAILRDRHGRIMEYIRVSLTEQCNYSCPFCMPSGAGSANETPSRLSSQEILRLCRIFSGMGVSNFKITGGEPLLYRDALSIVAALKQYRGVQGVTITTNGSTLDRDAVHLATAGVDGVNISLNALTPGTYGLVTGSAYPVAQIVKNILLVKSLGLHVKLNMVPVRGLNEDDIVPIVDFALTHDIYLRFIELMPIGQGRCYEGIPRAEIMEKVEARFGKPEAYSGQLGSGPAIYYTIGRHRAKIGYIAAVSRQFCATCNRVRLSATGFLKTCLHHNHGIDLSVPLRNGADDETLRSLISQAVSGKPAGHEFFQESLDDIGTTPMYRIGG